jgi:hypothetical protein
VATKNNFMVLFGGAVAGSGSRGRSAGQPQPILSQEPWASSGQSEGGIKVTRVRVESFSISIDGYGAGRDQSLDNPLGIGAEDLHEWLVSSRSWRQMLTFQFSS